MLRSIFFLEKETSHPIRAVGRLRAGKLPTVFSVWPYQDGSSDKCDVLDVSHQAGDQCFDPWVEMVVNLW